MISLAAISRPKLIIYAVIGAILFTVISGGVWTIYSQRKEIKQLSIEAVLKDGKINSLELSLNISEESNKVMREHIGIMNENLEKSQKIYSDITRRMKQNLNNVDPLNRDARSAILYDALMEGYEATK